MDVLRNPEKFGRTVGAARGAMSPPHDKKVHFAALIGKSLPTLRRIEAGELGSIGATVEERRQLAERVIRATGALPEWFGLSEPEPAEVDRLRQELLDEMDAAKAELNAELDAVWRALGQPRPKPLPGSPE